MRWVIKGLAVFCLMWAAPCFAVETAPQAQYFVPQPPNALFADEILPNPPLVTRAEFYPFNPVAPEAATAPVADIAPMAAEFYPQPGLVSNVDFLPSPAIAPDASRFYPQATAAPIAQEFLP